MSAPVSPPPLPELPVVLRPTRTRVVLLSGGTALVAVFTVIAVLLPSEGRTGWHLVDRIAFVGSALLILGVLTLLSRPKVVADADGVTVTNLTTTRRLEWAEIVRVNLRPGDAWVRLDLADGTSLAAMGIQPGVAQAQAVRDARILRALVDAYGTGTPA